MGKNQFRLILRWVFIIAIVFFVVQNISRRVQINFLGWTFKEVQVSLLLMVSFFLGLIFLSPINPLFSTKKKKID